jgi:hypothetical protein
MFKKKNLVLHPGTSVLQLAATKIHLLNCVNVVTADF